MGNDCILQVKNLKKYFGNPKCLLRAVDGVSFDIRKGTTLGLVGESGCGKTTIGRSILRLNDLTSGSVIFNGKNITNISSNRLRKLRPKMQIVFQDPYSSLNPRLPVGELIGEAVKTHKIVPFREYKDYIFDVMKKCGLQPEHYSRYPHEFSGGQRQRICIARTLALKPDFIVCDEPVSNLDVSIQAQILNLLNDLQDEFNISYLFISHDLSVVKHISNTVAVMYLGCIVEMGSKDQIFKNPMHPYTKALLSAVSLSDYKKSEITLHGELPSPVNQPKGCKFCTRCPSKMEICKAVTPVFKEYQPGHNVACHLYPQI